jgi:hypothetical protein
MWLDSLRLFEGKMCVEVQRPRFADDGFVVVLALDVQGGVREFRLRV